MIVGAPNTSSVSATGMRAMPADATDSGSVIGTVESLTVDVLFQAAQEALDRMIVSGTVAHAESMNLIMETLTTIDVNAGADARFAPLKNLWSSTVCASAQFAFNALSSFNFVSDYHGFERVMTGVIQWHRVAQEMDTYLRSVIGGVTCFNGLPDAQTRVHTKLTALQPSIVADLNAFSIEPPPQDVSFFADRVRPLINLAGTFEQANFSEDELIITNILNGQVTRLRPIGYARCRSSGKQAIQGHLARGIAEGVLTSVTRSARPTLPVLV